MDRKCQNVIGDALDWCQAVASHNVSGPCLFSDILDLLPHGTLSPEWPYSKKLDAVNACGIANQAHCIRHGKVCSVNKMTVFDVSGLPCPDMSVAGLRRKRAGPTCGVYLAHGKYASRNRIPLLLIECTEDSQHDFFRPFSY